MEISEYLGNCCFILLEKKCAFVMTMLCAYHLEIQHETKGPRLQKLSSTETGDIDINNEMVRLQCWSRVQGWGLGAGQRGIPRSDTELNLESWLKQPKAFQAGESIKHGRALSIQRTASGPLEPE